MRKLYIPLLLSLFACLSANASLSNCDGAGNCYVNPSVVGGSGNGSSWTNACSSLSASACAVGSGTRPATPMNVWVATGTYTSQTFGLTANGTNVVTIIAPTASNHGTSTGYSSALLGTATFGADSTATTSYWAFNGQEWAGSSCTGLAACGVDAAYHIYFHNATDFGGWALNVGQGQNYNLSYVDLGGPYTISNWSTNPASDQPNDVFITSNSTTNPVNNVYVGYSYLHEAGADIVGSNGQSSSTNVNGDSHTYEHDFFARNWYTCTSTNCTHTQAMSECTTNLVVRYNVFFDTVEDGVIDINVSNTCPIAGWSLYGNTIEWDNNIPSIRQALVGSFVGGFGQTIASGQTVNIYNNTMANVGGQYTGANVQAAWFCWSTGVGSTNAGTVNIYNNLFWQSGNSSGGGTASDVACGTIPGTSNVDYTQGFCPGTGCTHGAGYSPTGAHSLNSNTGNPFVNFDGTSNFNVSLAANTSAGLSIPGWTTAPSTGFNLGSSGYYNLDPFTVTRGVNGTIDRGAFQIGSPIANAPSFSPPAGTYNGTQSVSLTTSSSGAIICYNLTGAPATNGSTGCTTGTLYTVPINISSNSTIYAVAGGTGYTDSSVSSAAYTINAGASGPAPWFAGNLDASGVLKGAGQ